MLSLFRPKYKEELAKISKVLELDSMLEVISVLHSDLLVILSRLHQNQLLDGGLHQHLTTCQQFLILPELQEAIFGKFLNNSRLRFAKSSQFLYSFLRSRILYFPQFVFCFLRLYLFCGEACRIRIERHRTWFRL